MQILCVKKSKKRLKNKKNLGKMNIDGRGERKMNTEKNIMITTNPDGTQEEVEVLLAFKFNDNNKEYVIYTKNEVDDNGNVTIYISNIIRSGDAVTLETVSDDAEWTRIKGVLRELSKTE